MHPCPLQAVPLSWSSLGQETLGILKWASITQAAPSPGTKLPVGAAQAGCVNINKINGSLVFTLLLLLLTVVLDSVDLGPGALVHVPLIPHLSQVERGNFLGSPLHFFQES